MTAPLDPCPSPAPDAMRLIVTVRFMDGRWHGAGAWPPAPLRLFQALVAGAAEGRRLPDDARAVLAALEALPPPAILAPRARLATGHTAYVPNNSLDAVGGDPARIGEIRVGKTTRARLFELDSPLVYVWPVPPGAELPAEALGGVIARLYQLGRGVDPAFAAAEILPETEASARLAGLDGIWHHPGGGEAATALACPTAGTLASLIDRHLDRSTRFRVEGKGRSATTVVTTPRRAVERMVSYGATGVRLLFDLVDTGIAGMGTPPWPAESVVDRVAWIRDAALARLLAALADRRTGAVDPVLAATARRVFGLERDAGEADKAQRLRILPIPSIGMAYTDPRIRRVLVMLPPDMPLAVDVAWSFRGLSLPDPDGQPLVDLVEARDHAMLRHYAIGFDDAPAAAVRPWEHATPAPARRDARRPVARVAADWITITPIAVPPVAARRRVDPTRRQAEAKGGGERAGEESAAIAAIRRAIDHAGIPARATAIEVRREPFLPKGIAAERFAAPPRFPKERLWHARVRFDRPVPGPVILGDGRYLGLGLMAVDKAPAPSLHAFTLDRAVARDEAAAVVAAFRRAMMARVGAVLGRGPDTGLPEFFSGHAGDGSVARAGTHRHLYLAVLPGTAPVALVIAPHLVGRRVADRDEGNAAAEHRRGIASREELGDLATLADALVGFDRLALGAGHVRLGACATPAPLLGPARHWVTATPYAPTRHAGKRDDLAAHIAADCGRDALARGLPRPVVEVLRLLPGGRALLGLDFAIAIEGPILLGRDAHKGGGLFISAPPGAAIRG